MDILCYVKFLQGDKVRDKEFCWKTCGGNLNEGPRPEIPTHIKWAYTPSYSINITWDGDGILYLLEMRDKFVDNEYSNDFVSLHLTILFCYKLYKEC